VVVGEEVNQPHAPFCGQDVLHLLERRLQGVGIRLRHNDVLVALQMRTYREDRL
jgi:hypothetical protein